MASPEPPTQETQPSRTGLDPDSAEWLRVLTGTGSQREAGLARLHEMLLHIAASELRRRASQHRIAGPELDDLAHHSAADALLAITGKLGQFRGDSRFTTWAFKFVVLEVSNKIGRHFWRTPSVRFDLEDWDRLPDRFGLDPDRESQWQDLLAAVRTAVEKELTPRQRQVFTALILAGTPLDVLATQLDTSRGAIYKTLYDARRKLRAVLVANGYLNRDTTRQP